LESFWKVFGKFLERPKFFESILESFFDQSVTFLTKKTKVF